MNCAKKKEKVKVWPQTSVKVPKWRGQTAEEELQSFSLWEKNHIHRKIDKMKRQRAMYQMKEQDKTPEKQLKKWR